MEKEVNKTGKVVEIPLGNLKLKDIIGHAYFSLDVETEAEVYFLQLVRDNIIYDFCDCEQPFHENSVSVIATKDIDNLKLLVFCSKPITVNSVSIRTYGCELWK